MKFDESEIIDVYLKIIYDLGIKTKMEYFDL
jgi:DNA-binding MltR family transcriptional regulator